MDAVNAFNQEVSCLQGSMKPELSESGGAVHSVALELAEQDQLVGLYGKLAGQVNFTCLQGNRVSVCVAHLQRKLCY